MSAINSKKSKAYTLSAAALDTGTYFAKNAAHGKLMAISVNFSAVYTGTISWKVVNAVSGYDQTFTSSSLTAVTQYYINELHTYMEQDSTLQITTSAVFTGTVNVRIWIESNGY